MQLLSSWRGSIRVLAFYLNNLKGEIMKTADEMNGDFTVKLHSYNGTYYADVFLATGGYCIVQFRGKSREASKRKALDWIRKQISTNV